jgi:aminopeptidase N
VREVSGWDDILQTQLSRMKNPDRKARFAFALPALSADREVRDRWFQSLKDVENRRHEPWVLDGLSFLNHPLRAANSIAYVRSALELLPEIQRTGDIFFPTRWMTAALSGHTSREAADLVRTYLAALPPDYPPRLKAIILQTSDELFRAASPTP